MTTDSTSTTDAASRDASALQRGVRPLDAAMTLESRLIGDDEGRAALDALMAEIRRLSAELAKERSRACATETDCIHQPWCGQVGQCVRTSLPAA